MSEMKMIMENWRSSLDEILGFGGQKEPDPAAPQMKTAMDIKTVGDLRALIQTAQLKKRGEQLKSGVVDAAKSAIVDEIVGKVPGLSAAKNMFDLARSAYALPDEATQGTALKYLNVDDDVSKIVDDPIENAFLANLSTTLEKDPDDTKLEDIDITQRLQLYLADTFNKKTVTGMK
tara:strand:+ start:500 stop:1027 length:528 start_codon:yes stop_codon:yes gene_type:complete